MEQGPPETLFARAAHPYTRALMAAVPGFVPGARRVAIPIAPAALDDGPGGAGTQAATAAAAGASGCAYAARCPWRQRHCVYQAPPGPSSKAAGAMGMATRRAPGTKPGTAAIKARV